MDADDLLEPSKIGHQAELLGKLPNLPALLPPHHNIGFGSDMSPLDLAKPVDAKFEFIDKRQDLAGIPFANAIKARKILKPEPIHILENI